MALTATFSPDAGSALRVRAWLEEALTGRDLTAAVKGDSVLVASELTGNAVRHAHTDFTVSVSFSAGKLRLEVFDGDTRPPALLALDEESTSGRGLHIVAALADEWGWFTCAADGISGKVVWAELGIASTGDPAAG